MIKLKKIRISFFFTCTKRKKNSFSYNRNGFSKIAILTQQAIVSSVNQG